MDIKKIKERIKSGIEYSQIQKEFGIRNKELLKKINSGKYYYDPNEHYPLCNKTGRHAKNKQWISGIIEDLIEKELSFQDISVKWNKSIKTIHNINVGRCGRRAGQKYPLR